MYRDSGVPSELNVTGCVYGLRPCTTSPAACQNGWKSDAYVARGARNAITSSRQHGTATKTSPSARRAARETLRTLW